MHLRSGTVVGAHILKPEHRPAFEEGVRQIFMRWTALCLAIENEWGGASSREKGSQLVEEVTEWFYRKKGAHTGCRHAAAAPPILCLSALVQAAVKVQQAVSRYVPDTALPLCRALC